MVRFEYLFESVDGTTEGATMRGGAVGICAMWRADSDLDGLLIQCNEVSGQTSWRHYSQ
jgi:hypothetical protein